MTAPQPGWYADPSAAFDLRWWDGTTWTADVVRAGLQSTSPLGALPERQGADRPDRIRQQVQQAGGGSTPGTGSLFTEPVLVVNQKTKIVELTNEYAVYDAAGRPIGSVVEIGQSTMKKAMRFVSSLDQYMTHRLEVRDAQGVPQLLLTRPAKVMRSRVVVQRPDGTSVGELVQENMIGKIRFGLMVDGKPVGSLNAQNWRAWDFQILDVTGTEVARIKKTFEGLAKTMFTTADNYVVHVHQPLQDPLLSLVVASALCVDTALKQDSRGLG